MDSFSSFSSVRSGGNPAIPKAQSGFLNNRRKSAADIGNVSNNHSFNSDNVISPGTKKFGSQFNLAGKELHSSSSETSSEGYVSEEVDKIELVETEETKERASLSDLQDSELNEERKYHQTEPNKSIDQSEDESESRAQGRNKKMKTL